MKNSLIVFFLLMSIGLFAQEREAWLRQLENPSNVNYRLRPENRLAEFSSYDFSELLMPKVAFIGYIGKFVRARVTFLSVTKNRDTVDVYNVQGELRFKKDTYSFRGRLKLEQVREYKKMHFGADSMYKSLGIRSQGIAIGSYEWHENPLVPFSGCLKGIVTLKWYVDGTGKLCYDDLERLSSDAYCNNQYVGTWTSYGTGQSLTCNWGEHRIPFSKGLDVGDGEFSPSPLYESSGWANYEGTLPVVHRY
jgi:hypothetical protein